MSEQELSPQEKSWDRLMHLRVYNEAWSDCLAHCKETMVSKDLVENLVSTLRYGKNEMTYRIYQIEGGHDIPLTGEMHDFVHKAEEALAAYEQAVKESEE